MALHGLLAEEEPLSDVTVRETFDHEVEDLALSLSQSEVCARPELPKLQARGEQCDATCEGAVDHGLTRSRPLEHHDELLAGGLLEEVPARTRAQSPKEVGLIVVGAVEDHRRRDAPP